MWVARPLLLAAVTHAACDFAPPALSVDMLKRLGEFRRGGSGGPVLYRKHSKTASTTILAFLERWRASRAADGAWTVHPLENAGAFDPRCADVLEAAGALLVTSLRAPINRTVSQFEYTRAARFEPRAAADAAAWHAWLSAPPPPAALALSAYAANYYVRALTGRCEPPLSARACLRGCPLGRDARANVTPAELEQASAALARFHVVLLTERLGDAAVSARLRDQAGMPSLARHAARARSGQSRRRRLARARPRRAPPPSGRRPAAGAGGRTPLPPSVADRLLSENALDAALYERAVSLDDARERQWRECGEYAYTAR